MPDCPRKTPQGLIARVLDAVRQDTTHRAAVADFTPDYLRIVPLPSDMKPSTTKNAFLKANAENRSMPMQLQQFYGFSLSRKLKFAVILRAPLSQMQSAWYHAKSFNFQNACESCKAPSFKAALASAIAGLNAEPPTFTGWLWTVMYARQLEHWFEQFLPSQFLLIPKGEYTKRNTDGVCRRLRDLMAFSMDCTTRQGAKATHEWAHQHPTLAGDLPAEMRSEFQTLMKKEESRLVKLLAEAYRDQGLHLAGFSTSTRVAPLAVGTGAGAADDGSTSTGARAAVAPDAPASADGHSDRLGQSDLERAVADWLLSRW
eukprot:TRINITY_DN21843_c0_g1_i1.p1 TRINITY_DN21843_c0_g1~~TRINITY_DN21843_c0_g1_i1.p1  ORF type:complete len:316 (+),score=55.30 TRINITY_DN21843_c0_g1_i1:514-1461(+)